jgi:hypothetical protein
MAVGHSLAQIPGRGQRSSWEGELDDMKKVKWLRSVVVASCSMALMLHIEGTEHAVSHEESRTRQQPGLTAQQRVLQDADSSEYDSLTRFYRHY